MRRACSVAVGFKGDSHVFPWRLVEQAASAASLRGTLILMDRGSAGFWVHSRNDLFPFALALARLHGQITRWYQVVIEDNTLDTRAASLTPDGQQIPSIGVADRSELQEPTLDPLVLVDDVLAVLLEMHEAVHVDDGWSESRSL